MYHVRYHEIICFQGLYVHRRRRSSSCLKGLYVCPGLLFCVSLGRRVHHRRNFLGLLQSSSGCLSSEVVAPCSSEAGSPPSQEVLRKHEILELSGVLCVCLRRSLPEVAVPCWSEAESAPSLIRCCVCFVFSLAQVTLLRPFPVEKLVAGSKLGFAESSNGKCY